MKTNSSGRDVALSRAAGTTCGRAGGCPFPAANDRFIIPVVTGEERPCRLPNAAGTGAETGAGKSSGKGEISSAKSSSISCKPATAKAWANSVSVVDERTEKPSLDHSITAYSSFLSTRR